MKRITRRVAAAMAAAALAVGLAGCGVSKQSGPAELSDDPVTLRMYWWGGDGRHQRTQQVIDLFEKKHPNITVEPEFADWSGYWEKLATATAGKNAPDVIQMDALYLAEYAGRGALADLTDLNIKTSGMQDSVRDMGVWGDRFYAAPISTSSMALIVNSDLLNKIGVPLPDNTDTWTYDEYAEWATKVSNAAPEGVYGGAVMSIDYQLQLFARQHGDQLFDGTKVVINPETLEAFFQANLDWMKSGATPPASVYAESSTLPLDQSSFATGKAVSTFNMATLVSAYAKASGANVELVKLPRVKGGVEKFDYFKPGMYWSVSSQAKHPAEAALLIDFFLNDPEAVKIIGTERGIPANSNTLDLIANGLTPDEVKGVEYTKSQISQLGDAPGPSPSGSSEMGTLLSRYLQEVLFERITPAEAAKRYIADLQAAIDAAN